MLRIVHFEIPVDNPQRAITFYKEVFGWEFTKWEGGEMEYWLVKTGDDSQVGINGGLMKRMMPIDGESPTAFVCTMDVPNYDVYLGKILKAGGKVVTQKTEIPKMGWMSYFKDTEGNTFGIMEMLPGASM